MITKKIALGFVVALLAWIALLIGITRLPNAAPAALVLFPSSEFIKSLPPDVRIIDYTPVSITLTSKKRDAGAFYALGAYLVLPAGLTGCIPTPISRTIA